MLKLKCLVWKNQLMIIKRRIEWGASVPNTSKPYYLQVPDKIIFHHYGFPADEPNFHVIPFFEGDKSIRVLQKEDIKVHGLTDIKFHYVIAPNGVVYECRPTTTVGRHMKHKIHDNGSIGVLVWGNYNVEQVPDEVKIAIPKLLMYLKEKHTTIKMPGSIIGHSDIKLTSCPGFKLKNFLNFLNR